ncbi:MAG: DUF1282 domain-containing protein [Alphaproteobacteria bacterium]|nr:DUF1282 domain-containing protein [Alphaproteobacteria bacterium]
MSVIEPEGGTAQLIARVRNIILRPKEEWPRIAAERTSLMPLLTGYVLPLAAVAAAAGFIGRTVFGYRWIGLQVRAEIPSALAGAVMEVVFTLVGVSLLGLVINALAPRFGAAADADHANKLAAYASTAGILSGVVMLFPPLAPLGVVGLYSLYLLFLGLRPMMKVPEGQHAAYALAVVLVAMTIQIVIGWAVGDARIAAGRLDGWLS